MKSSTTIFLRNLGLVLIAVIFVSSCKKEKQLETQDLKFQLESYYVSSGNESHRAHQWCLGCSLW